MNRSIQKSNKEVKTIIKNTLILFAITAVAGLFLSLVHSLTAEAITRQKILQKEKALAVVLPDVDFLEVENKSKENYPNVLSVFEAKTKDGEQAGYAFLVNGKGYGGVISVMVGVNKEGQLTGMDILNHSETPGLGAEADQEPFKSQIVGKKATEKLLVAKGSSDGQKVDAISGATITSEAVVTAINEAVMYYNDVLKGEKK